MPNKFKGRFLKSDYTKAEACGQQHRVACCRMGDPKYIPACGIPDTPVARILCVARR